MNSRRAGVIAILFICLLTALWALSTLLPEGTSLLAKGEIEVTHRVDGERHSYTGEVPVDAPCDGIGISGSIDPGLAQAHLTLLTQRLPGITCPAEKTTVPFSVNVVSATQPTDIVLTLDGKPLAVRMIEK